MIFWLLLLGIFTYLIVQRSVASITRTPVWILWLVMMMPAFIWTAWILVNGENAPPPLPLLIAPFIVCPVIYWFLIQWGRPEKSELPAEQQSKEPGIATPSPMQDKRPTLRPIDKEEEAALQNCFPWSIYYLQNIEYRPQALICRGQLRTSPEVAYKTIQENIESRFRDRFLVVFQEGLNGKPFFALVPNPQAQTAKPNTEKLARPGIALGLLVATILTTTLAGIVFTGISDDDLQADPSLLLTGLPYALALMAILGVHELAHYLAAQRYHIRTTFPYFIPVPPAAIFPFGTFGAFIQMRSPVPSRKALFDVGIAGPLAGFVITVPLLIWGLANSTTTALTEESSILNFESFRPSSSLLIAVLSRLALGNQLTANSALQLHPVAIAGCLGLVVTALNLMPVGQLDGGHIVHAMFGQRIGAVIGQVARLLVLALSFVQRELLLWAILLFFIPVVDEPALNDVSELDNQRDFWGLVALSLLVIIILPAPQAITQVLF
ncbi:site-2 protease family protein [Oculatella sp. LEGE 06141]|uniref:site-2 protease family protein n=1 Tax=Oculatella sp. LEGE 06141 TaxID=1828648 RepID=UPI0018815A7D|nr:site-2 protease family protein [Oculatella sp. LEGE 06141]MBE9181669.1 site-2 protease family protein [Oculatella sp. LEGE 06141]